MRRKRKKRAKNRPNRGIYILPNLITAASLFCGFYAIVAAVKGRFESAAMAVLISCLLDGLDGRIARITRTESHFGTEFDSLSDLVAFGVAPGLLAFQWAMEPFGRLGWLASFLFVACGALRLARFNVQKSSVKGSYFRGLPIPAAASLIAALVLFTESFKGPSVSRHIVTIALMYILSFLMVSTIRYYSFKNADLIREKPFNVLVGSILILIVIAYKPIIMLFLLLAGYVASGPILSLPLFKKWRARDGVAPDESSPLDSLKELHPSDEPGVGPR